MFIGEGVNVTLVGITWEPKENVTNDTTLFFDTFVNGALAASGNFSLADVGRELPSELFCGTVSSSVKGTTTITVILSLDDVIYDDPPAENSFQTYSPGLSIVPLIIILILAMMTRMVEFSLYMGVFVGACIINGNINKGFTSTLDTYILGALADADHVYVILFTLFLSGLVGMMVRLFFAILMCCALAVCDMMHKSSQPFS
jgi:hypothetical protein